MGKHQRVLTFIKGLRFSSFLRRIDDWREGFPLWKRSVGVTLTTNLRLGSWRNTYVFSFVSWVRFKRVKRPVVTRDVTVDIVSSNLRIWTLVWWSRQERFERFKFCKQLQIRPVFSTPYRMFLDFQYLKQVIPGVTTPLLSVSLCINIMVYFVC